MRAIDGSEPCGETLLQARRLFARLRTDRPSHRRGFGGLHRKTLAPFPICSRRERKHAKPKHNCGEFPYGAHPSWYAKGTEPVRCLFSSLEGFLPVADANSPHAENQRFFPRGPLRRLLDFARRSVAPFSLFRRTLCSLRIPHGTPPKREQHPLFPFWLRAIDGSESCGETPLQARQLFYKISHGMTVTSPRVRRLARQDACALSHMLAACPTLCPKSPSATSFPYAAHPSWYKPKSTPRFGLYGGVGAC